MNKGISLVELAQKIEAQQAAKVDMIADTRDLTMHDNGKLLSVRGGPNDGERSINQTAHDQIAGRLGIPATYYKRMQAEAPELLATNVNKWFHQKPERRMVRTLDGNVRAFLSDRYQRIDNHEIAAVALPVLLNMPGLRIVSSEITERRMYIQAVTERVTEQVKVGDHVQAGVIISNSEIGAGAVAVKPVTFRLVCLNGMVSQDGAFRANHVGRKVEDNEALWADDTRKADDRAVLLKVRDMVTSALDEIQFKARVTRMAGLTEQRISGDPAKAVEVLSQKIGATETEKGGILRALIEGGDLSAWGVLNAVTAQAHTAAYDRSVEFETAGGNLLDLPRGEWTRILEAA